MGKKNRPVDGFGPSEIARVRSAVRSVWQYSLARRLVISRCTHEDGYTYCEKCKERCPKLFVDHIEKVGDLDGGWLKRMFVPSSELQGICKPCHTAKTKEEKRLAKNKSME